MRTDSTWSRALCLCLSITLIFPPAALAAGQPGEPAPPDVAAQLEQFAADYENACRLIEELLPQIPRDTFDLKVIVEQARSEPTRIFKWVRDNTYLVPYRGLLRSGQGVLMDRLGNSLDRAMLLYELLALSGEEGRLARGTLSDEQLQTLIDGRRKVPPQGALPRSQEASNDDVATLIAELAQKHGLDAAKLSMAAEEQARKAEELREQAMVRVAAQTEALLSLLGDLQEKASAAELARPQGEAYRDHWWVQWNKNGRWIDLDPTLPNAKPAQTLADAKTTLLPKDLDDEVKHLVEIRVIAEIWERRKLAEVTLLSHILQPSEVLGKRVTLTHYPVNWPKDLNPFSKGATFERFRKELLEQREWLPLLRIDHQALYENSVTLDGTINESPELGQAAATIKKIGTKLEDFGDAIGGLGAPAKPKEHVAQAADKVLTAVWVEYALLVPGQSTKEIRRQIFDLIGPAARNKALHLNVNDINAEQKLNLALNLFTETEIFLHSHALSAAYLSDMAAQALLANKTTIPDMLRQVSRGNFGSLAKAPNLKVYASWSQVLAASRTFWRRECIGVFLDRPNILTYRSGARSHGKDRISRFHGFDIVTNRFAVALDFPISPFRERLQQGVLDTYAETLILSVPNAPDVEADSVLAPFSPELDKWIALESFDDLHKTKIELSTDLRIRVEKELGAGYIVVLPRPENPWSRSMGFGWWRVDKKSGQTLGMDTKGRGANLVEYSFLVKGALATAIGAASALCPFIAGYDKDGLTLKDGIRCAIGGVIGGAAVLSNSILAMVGGLASAIMAGIDGNTNPWTTTRIF